MEEIRQSKQKKETRGKKGGVIKGDWDFFFKTLRCITAKDKTWGEEEDTGPLL